MNYEMIGQDTVQTDENLSLEHARKKGIHDAASDVVRLTTLALVAIGVFTVLPDKWIGKAKKQVRGFLP